MSSPLLTPFFSSVKRELLTHKLKAGPLKCPLVLWTGSCNPHIILNSKLTAECQQDQHVQNCPAHPTYFHFKNTKVWSPCFFVKVSRGFTAVLFSSCSLSSVTFCLLMGLTSISCTSFPGFSVCLTFRVTLRLMIALPLCTHGNKRTLSEQFQSDNNSTQ